MRVLGTFVSTRRVILVREYLYREQLAEHTPWSEQAIDAMVKRGVLRHGVHYFQPQGRRGRLMFKWSAVVKLIEGNVAQGVTSVVDCGPKRTQETNGNANADVEEAKKALYRLLD